MRAVRVIRPGTVTRRGRRVLSGRDDLVGQSDTVGPPQEVVRERGDRGRGCVGEELAGGEVCEGLVFEVTDPKLDDGVTAVL